LLREIRTAKREQNLYVMCYGNKYARYGNKHIRYGNNELRYGNKFVRNRVAGINRRDTGTTTPVTGTTNCDTGTNLREIVMRPVLVASAVALVVCAAILVASRDSLVVYTVSLGVSPFARVAKFCLLTYQMYFVKLGQ
jgi:hypothetical protein